MNPGARPWNVVGRRAPLAVLVAAAVLAAACTPEVDTATATPTNTPTVASPTPAGTGSAAPSPPLPTASATASPTGSPGSTPPTVLPSPSSTPSAPGPGQAPPAGYAQSCARDVPWGVQVTKPFICLDGPPAGTQVAPGGRLQVTGYAGGSFENNVVVELWTLVNRQPLNELVTTPLTYTAPDIGMPGKWEATLVVPPNVAPGDARVIAHFDSPRDGSVVAQDVV
ncbi:MAG: hypothetical protein AB7G21_13190, partial [Dehalococcoidia bacterium]